ncbi:MAG: 6-pyruvoyl tetrahydropterin synthase family protein [Ignavibacteriales bacterium]|nr:6-pyruvoyl tetrahydropterin synthase family protein [Ignavibacteriales bacterium]
MKNPVSDNRDFASLTVTVHITNKILIQENMKIAKEFRWEMGHRLPEHFGQCKNIHGHSYKMLVEFDGELDKQGMIIDYYDVEKIINPIIEKLDHAFMVNKDDKIVLEFLEKMNSKKLSWIFNRLQRIYVFTCLMKLRKHHCRKM